MASSKHTTVVPIAEARSELLKGLNMTADAVGCTLGPHGMTVLIQNGDEQPLVTKDGVTVSKSINPKEPLLLMGARMVQEAAKATNDVAGDGTTTATILTQAMVNGCARLSQGLDSRVDMKRGIEVATKYVLDRLMTLKQDVRSNDDITSIATISANGSREFGELIAGTFEKVSANGIISIEAAKGLTTDVVLLEGMKLDRGYVSSYFVTRRDRMSAEFEKCRILVTTEKLTDMNDVVHLLNESMRTREPLLIIADDIDGTALQTLSLNKVKQTPPLQIVAIRSPGQGQTRHDLLTDICALTGAKLLGPTGGSSVKSFTNADLGRCDKVIVDRDSTTLIGGKGTGLQQHVEDLGSMINDVTITADKQSFLRLRLASLTGGVAVVRVGGATEMEINEKKDRIEDALNATRAALEEGIVAGGGCALLKASDGLLSLEPDHDVKDNHAFRCGLMIVRDGCHAPFKRIVQNAGKNHELIMKSIGSSKFDGYDAAGERYVNMLDAGVIDPVKVTRNALMNASSVALTFLSLDAVVVEEAE